jgi:hypothetical protein
MLLLLQQPHQSRCPIMIRRGKIVAVRDQLHIETDQTIPVSYKCRKSQSQRPNWSTHEDQSNAMLLSTSICWTNILLHSFHTRCVKILAHIQPPTKSLILVQIILKYFCTLHTTVLSEMHALFRFACWDTSVAPITCSRALQVVTSVGIIIYLHSIDHL